MDSLGRVVALSRHVRTPEGSRMFKLPIGAPIVAHPRVHLNAEDRVSVAENVMANSGLRGRRWKLPVLHYDDPARSSALAPVHEFVRGVLTRHGMSPDVAKHIVVTPNHWDLREPGSGMGTTDGLNYIGVKADTDDLTLLHEAAHILTGTPESEDSHGPAFQKIAQTLYREHISPTAGKTFAQAVQVPGQYRVHDISPGKYHVKGTRSVGKAHLLVGTDGSGTYINSRGVATALTPAQVLSRHSAGMNHSVPPTQATFGAELDAIHQRHPDVELTVSTRANPASDGLPVHKVYMVRVTLGKKSGKGAAVMNELTTAADKHQVGLVLTPEALGTGGMSTAKLTAWYKGMGFTKNTDNALSGTLVRRPVPLTPSARPPDQPRATGSSVLVPAPDENVANSVLSRPTGEYAESTHRMLVGTLTGVKYPDELDRPLYHGTKATLAPGDYIEPGHPGNYVRRMTHVYAHEDIQGARNYAHGVGTVYEVEPTGPIGHRRDAKGANWASQWPMRVVRVVPEEVPPSDVYRSDKLQPHKEFVDAYHRVSPRTTPEPVIPADHREFFRQLRSHPGGVLWRPEAIGDRKRVPEAERAYLDHGVAVHVPSPEVVTSLAAVHIDAIPLVEQDHSLVAATVFHDAILAATQANAYGAAVHVYSPEEYTGMKLLIAKDGSSGVAIQPDGNIVSAFANPAHPGKKRGLVTSLVETAVDNGGTHMDAFEGVLPGLYGVHGFKAVARVKFEPYQAPVNWPKSLGHPDIVFLAHDDDAPAYKPGDGPMVADYDEAQNIARLAGKADPSELEQSRSQKAAVRWYVRGQHGKAQKLWHDYQYQQKPELNKVLRKGDTPEGRAILKLVDTAFEKGGYTTAADITLYRGLKAAANGDFNQGVDPFVAEDFTKVYQPGTIVQDAGMVSATESRSAARGWLHDYFAKRPEPVTAADPDRFAPAGSAVMVIHVPAGTRVLGGITNGIETMLAPGTRFRVTAITHETSGSYPGTVPYIHMDVIPPERVQMVPVSKLMKFQSYDAGWDADGVKDTMKSVLDVKGYRHPDFQQDLTESIRRHGIKEPLVVAMHTKPPTLLEGHHRLLAAKTLKLPEVPVVDAPTYRDDDAPSFMLPPPVPSHAAISVPVGALKDGEKAYGGREDGYRLRGTGIAWDDPRIPAAVYHVSTDGPAVRKSGYLRAGGAGGLGGDSKDKIVSFTTSAEIATDLRDNLKLVAEVAQNYPDPLEYDTEARGIANDALMARLGRQTLIEGWSFSTTAALLMKTARKRYGFKDILNQYYMARSSALKKPNPLFFSSLTELKKIDPDKVEVFAVPKKSLDNGAQLTDFDLGQGSLDEIRSYGNVALSPVNDSAEAMKAAFDKGHTVVETYSTGAIALKVQKVILSDGSLAILKSVYTEREVQNEVLAAKVANALGISEVHAVDVSSGRTPEELADIPDHRVLMSFGDGVVAAEAVRAKIVASRDYEDQHDVVANLVKHKNSKEIALMDYIISNNDRHLNNWLVSNDNDAHIIPIDHSDSFNIWGLHPNSPFVLAWVWPIPQYTLAEMYTYEAALKALQPDFIALSGKEKYDTMMERFDEIGTAVTSHTNNDEMPLSGLRHVKTPAGAKLFKQPIGSVIVAHPRRPSIPHLPQVPEKFTPFSPSRVANVKITGLSASDTTEIRAILNRNARYLALPTDMFVKSVRFSPVDIRVPTRMAEFEDKTILARPLGLDKSPEAVKSYDTCQKKGWFTVTGTDKLDSIISHEFGHAVNDQILPNKDIWDLIARNLDVSPPGDQVWAYGTPTSNIDLDTWVGANREVIAEKVGRYSSTNSHELFAELWASYTGKCPTKFATEFGDAVVAKIQADVRRILDMRARWAVTRRRVVGQEAESSLDVALARLRHVKTPEGAKLFKQPIGSPIISHPHLPSIPHLPQVPEFSPHPPHVDTNEEMKAAFEKGYTVAETYHEGAVALEVEKVILSDGTPAILKSVYSEDEVRNEVLAATVANALGISGIRAVSVPRPLTSHTIQEEDPEGWEAEQQRNYNHGGVDSRVLMAFGDGVNAAAATVGLRWEAAVAAREKLVLQKNGKEIALLDYIISNNDRNTNNWLVAKDGHIIPIDHGETFQEYVGMRSPFIAVWIRPTAWGSNRPRPSTRGVSLPSINPNYTLAELDKYEASLKAIQGVFDAEDAQDEYVHMMDRFVAVRDAVASSPLSVALSRLRHVATPEGAKLFKQPIGSPIISHPRLPVVSIPSAVKTDTNQEMKAAYDKGYTVVEAYHGGASALSVAKVKLSDGTFAILKSVYSQDEVRNEVLAAKVANVLGITDSRAIAVSSSNPFRKHTTVLMSFGDGGSALTAFARTGVHIRSLVDHRNGKEIGMLDFLIHNLDRNINNWLVADDGHIIPIDHGMAFSSVSKMQIPYDNQFIDAWIRPVDNSQRTMQPNFSQADLDKYEVGLRTLKADFDEWGAQAQYSEMMARLAEVRDQAGYPPYSASQLDVALSRLRHVATPEGAKLFKQPIGSPIVSHPHVPRLPEAPRWPDPHPERWKEEKPPELPQVTEKFTPHPPPILLRVSDSGPEMKAAFEKGYTVAETYSEGQIALSVEKVILSDGSPAILKSVYSATEVRNEILAADVAHALGISEIQAVDVSRPSPGHGGRVLAERDDEGDFGWAMHQDARPDQGEDTDSRVLMSFADGVSPFAVPSAHRMGDPAKIVDLLVKAPNGKEIAMLDYLIKNTDRNLHNWLVAKDGHVIPIDHGETFRYERIPDEFDENQDGSAFDANDAHFDSVGNEIEGVDEFDNDRPDWHEVEPSDGEAFESNPFIAAWIRPGPPLYDENDDLELTKFYPLYSLVELAKYQAGLTALAPNFAALGAEDEYGYLIERFSIIQAAVMEQQAGHRAHLSALDVALARLRRVATPAGEKLYKLPIGSVIVSHPHLPSLPTVPLPPSMPEEMPPRLGQSPIPVGTVRLFHQTWTKHLPSIRAQGLLESHARGDGGLGAGNEPSAGVWASTGQYGDEKGPGSTSDRAVIEFYARPDQISKRASSPDDADPVEWAKSGNYHVIMRGDVPPSQIVAIHEPWHSIVRYMQQSTDPLSYYAWLDDPERNANVPAEYLKAWAYIKKHTKPSTVALTRHVKTPEGSKLFKLPIGSPILSHPQPIGPTQYQKLAGETFRAPAPGDHFTSLDSDEQKSVQFLAQLRTESVPAVAKVSATFAPAGTAPVSIMDTRYARSGYSWVINDALRKGETFGRVDERNYQQLRAETRAYRAPHNITVFRGVSHVGVSFKGDLTGSALTDKSFLSTSVSRDYAYSWSRHSFEPGIVEIIIPKGTPIGIVGGVESEIVIPDGSTLRVVSDRNIVSNGGGKFLKTFRYITAYVENIPAIPESVALTRHVKTPAGSTLFKLPIGSPIISHPHLPARAHSLPTTAPHDSTVEMKAAYDKGHTLVEQYSEGAVAMAVEKVKLSDGTFAILKQVWEPREVRNEVLAARVANALGISGIRAVSVSLPPMADSSLKYDKDGQLINQVLLSFAPGKPGFEATMDAYYPSITDNDDTARSVEKRLAGGKNGKQIAVLDYAIMNEDRNAGNWIVAKDGSITPIDHGEAFSSEEGVVHQYVDYTNPFISRWLASSVGDTDILDPTMHYTLAELEGYVRALRSTESDFVVWHARTEFNEMMIRMQTLLDAWHTHDHGAVNKHKAGADFSQWLKEYKAGKLALTRHVKTPEGSKLYKLPIGSVIVSHPHIPAVHSIKPQDSNREMKAAFAQGHTTVEKYSKGRIAMKVEKVKLSDGTFAVLKQVRKTTEVRNEVLAAAVANALGISSVRAVDVSVGFDRHGNSTAGWPTKGSHQVLMSFADGVPGINAIFSRMAEIFVTYNPKNHPGGVGKKLEQEFVGGKNGKQIAVLDYLVNNVDRNNGNWIVAPNGTVTPIDHGGAFASAQSFFDNPFIQRWLSASDKDQEVGAALNPYKNYTVDELKGYSVALKALQKDFGEWDADLQYRAMMARMARLIKYWRAMNTSQQAQTGVR